MQRANKIRGLTVAALLILTGLLAVAGNAQASPQPPPPRPLCPITKLTQAICDTANMLIALGLGEETCLYYTAPAYWNPTCTTIAIGPIPLAGYPFCYYNTAPANWATCV
jgi:hypothetical protein